MNNLSNVTFDQNIALTGDTTGMSKGGVYIGTIESATVKYFGQDGATDNTKITFKIKHTHQYDADTGTWTPDASVNQFMDVIVANKDGDSAGMKKIHTLLGLSGQTGLNVIKEKDDYGKEFEVISNFAGLPIAYACFKKERWGFDKEKKQKIQYGFNLLHFFDGKSLQTFSERVRGVAAETYLRKITDILEDPKNPPKVPGQPNNIKTPAQAGFNQSPMGNAFAQQTPPPINAMENALNQPNTMGENALASGGFPAQQK